MKLNLAICPAVVALAEITIAPASAQKPVGDTVPVTVDNFIRAESDLYLSAVALIAPIARLSRRRIGGRR